MKWLAMTQMVAFIAMAWLMVSSLGLPIRYEDNEQYSFSVLHINALRLNKKHPKAAKAMMEVHPDILIIHEYSEYWEQHVRQWENVYPHTFTIPMVKQCCYGIMLASKFPIEQEQIQWYMAGKIPILTVELSIIDKHLWIITTHTRNPLKQEKIKSRQEHLRLLAAIANSLGQSNLIVTGDFNITPWEKDLLNFKYLTGLTDARHGRLMPTFPTGLPMIPIDYQYYGNELKCSGAKTIQIPGSDHLGILATYSFKEQ
jgi:endonuclease/exonuclease/phosphatase (EEP) superfamily protein YafD